MNVIKRNGSEEQFDINKIISAISKANSVDDLYELAPNEIDEIALKIQNDCQYIQRTLSVEDIQDMVENQLMEHGVFNLAKRYITYRYTRSLVRQSNSTDEQILSLIECNNEEVKQENSNKNPIINSVQRDYMAGEVSKDITKRFLLPENIVKAHEDGIIHFHDSDYFAQHMHNCFHRNTRFITSEGEKAFVDFKDGEIVTVLDKDGVWRNAVVHMYGKQPMQQVTFQFGRSQINIVCTKDHRWILSDGSVTTNLSTNDKLWSSNGNSEELWKVADIKPYNDFLVQEAWCVEEPVTHSFTLENGIVTGNCCLINLEDMLQNGTVISGTLIEKPHSFSTACNITTQCIAQVASNQYGGQSITFSHLAPFVDISRQKFRKEVKKEFLGAGLTIDEEKINEIAEMRVKEEIKRGVQIIQYQVITLMTTNGQAPFVTMFMYLNEVPEGPQRDDLALIIEEVLNQRILGVKNEKGVYITQAFPKLIYVLEENNITKDSKYWYLTKLAAECTAKRIVPDYISEKKMLEYKIDKNGDGHCYPCMGCRSFLTPYIDENGNPKYYGRFNQGVVSINLVDVACSSKGDMDKFWEIFDERLELCHEALMCRHNRLLGTKSDAAPILWQHGALARLNKGEKIDKLLYGGYSTISLGYAGLYECVKYMTGKSHTDPEAAPFALEVMQHLNDACSKWKAIHNMDFSLYGTPIESTTYKFAKCLQKRFGIIPGVTDKNYITNSYHVHVTEEINAFDKLTIESQFQKLSPGGAVSYVEVPNMQNNIEAVLAVMQHIYENNIYAELNTKSDFCQECGFNGEIQIITDDNGKLVWECPQCGNRNQDKMNVARRTCGYIGTQFWNQGRTQEIKERVLHL